MSSEPNQNTSDALDMCEEVSECARALGIGLAKYLVEDVEAICAALRAVRSRPLSPPASVQKGEG